MSFLDPYVGSFYSVNCLIRMEQEIDTRKQKWLKNKTSSHIKIEVSKGSVLNYDADVVINPLDAEMDFTSTNSKNILTIEGDDHS